MNPIPPDSEVRAVEALITVALRPWDHEVTAEDVDAFMKADSPLSEEDAAALHALRNSLFQSSPMTEAAAGPELGGAIEELLVLYRKRPKAGFTESTAQEIEKRREELLKRLRGDETSK